MLSIRDLSVDYRISEGRLQVLRGVNLDFAPGQVTALIGESGSGKSTLTGAILGLLASNAHIRGGQILWKEQNLLELSAEKLREFRWRRAAVVFQAAQGAFNPTLTLGQQLLDSLIDHGGDLSRGRVRMRELLAQVRLDPDRVISAYPHQLSGGMRQRVLIAMALMLEPEMLILDEPTTALDLITQSYVFDILAEIHDRTGLTMVLITHDLAAVARLAQRVAVLYAGTVAEVAEADTLFDTPRHPYSQGLLGSVPSARGSKEVVNRIEGPPPDLLNPPSGCVFRARCPEAMERCAREIPILGVNHVACHAREAS